MQHKTFYNRALRKVVAKITAMQNGVKIYPKKRHKLHFHTR